MNFHRRPVNLHRPAVKPHKTPVKLHQDAVNFQGWVVNFRGTAVNFRGAAVGGILGFFFTCGGVGLRGYRDGPMGVGRSGGGRDGGVVPRECMVMSDYLPHDDVGLRQWASCFASKTSQDPALYGLTAAQTDAYSVAAQAFVQALRVTNDPNARTPVAITLKNAARRELVAQSRRLAMAVQSYSGTTDMMRLELGLTIRKAKRARMAGVPIDGPAVRVVAVESVFGDQVKLRIGAADRGGRPATAKGYTLYSYIGSAAPNALSQWTFVCNGVEQRRTVKLPADVPAGATVHFVAHWLNNRMQPGPLGTAVQTRVAGRRAA